MASSTRLVIEPRRHAVQPAFALRLLRRFELTRLGQSLLVPPSGQRILALLALSDGALSRAHIAGTLWPDGSDARAAAALRTALWRIGTFGELVHGEGDMVVLDGAVSIDLVVLSTCARALLGDVPPARLGEDLSRLRDAGEVLPGWYDDWVLIERERFRQLHANALEALCLRLSGEGRYADATDAGIAAVACEPLRESAHRALVCAHLAAGNASDALRQYELCRDLLDRHLGLAPSPRLVALVDPVRQQ